jgi:hypothetical protein
VIDRGAAEIVEVVRENLRRQADGDASAPSSSTMGNFAGSVIGSLLRPS